MVDGTPGLTTERDTKGIANSKQLILGKIVHLLGFVSFISCPTGAEYALGTDEDTTERTTCGCWELGIWRLLDNIWFLVILRKGHRVMKYRKLHVTHFR